MTRCEARSRLAQVIEAKPGGAVTTERDRRSVGALLGAYVAKYGPGLLSLCGSW